MSVNRRMRPQISYGIGRPVVSTPHFETYEFPVSGVLEIPSDVDEVWLYGMAAGGGGGSGSVAATTYAGGGAGCGGTFITRRLMRSEFATGKMVVTIGAGGVGGTAVTADSTNGNAGSSGGDTQVDINGTTVLKAKGGGGGGAGTTTAGANGSAPAISGNTPAPPTSGYVVGVPQTAASQIGLNQSQGGGGARGGQGATVTNTSGSANPCAQGLAGTSVNGAVGSGLGSPNYNGQDGNKAFDTFHHEIRAKYVCAGTGGGAGFGAGTLALGINGGNGGNGACGAGGGGGGGAINGLDAGAGGQGGDGFVYVVFFRNVAVEYVEYVTAGEYNLVIDDTVVAVHAFLLGAGGGGGAGYRSDTTTIFSGSSGGGGRFLNLRLIGDLSEKGTWKLTVGAGGVGATAAAANVRPNNGGQGGDTYITNPNGKRIATAWGGDCGRSGFTAAQASTVPRYLVTGLGMAYPSCNPWASGLSLPTASVSSTGGGGANGGYAGWAPSGGSGGGLASATERNGGQGGYSPALWTSGSALTGALAVLPTAHETVSMV
ncbi:MAG: hypothetical protein IPF79_04605 [Ignavibacteria bacterium]|nr:hypothetical protein [Ignavibacteria bacterium]